ncbi:MAG: RNA degradosome polyphosphate kinase [Muribaculaceae bacterium]|nr:RNA degradosome polyphosphate kinase [Muribaculaceae bacterium]
MSDTLARPTPYYIERDKSWMFFNHRILQEARRRDVPTLDRLTFLGIYSSNLDEFFRVRMATLSRLAEMTGRDVADDARHARELFTQLTAMDAEFSAEYEQALAELRANLESEGIMLVNESSLTPEQQHHVRCLFRSQVGPCLTPIWLSHLDVFSRESDSRIYLAIELQGLGCKTEYAVLQLPTDECGRFVPLPDADGKHCVMYLDDVIRFSLPMLFPGMGYTDFKAYSFKFTKDAEMDLDKDSGAGPLQKIARGVRSRRNGAALRVIYDADMPENLLKTLMKKLKLDTLDTVKPSGRYHNHKDFMGFPVMGRNDLHYEEWRPVVPPELKTGESLLQLISASDRFIHVPYHTFDYLIRLLQEAAVSRHVKSIKMTLYRVAKNSKVVKALICAARNGKKVTVVVELLARFDESSNISWAKTMQEAGINVVFGVEGLKVHSKLLLIGMKHGHDIAVAGTGNFHEGNAKTYTDYFLMTSRPALVNDIKQVFAFINRPYRLPELKHILMSPVNMRQRFTELIEREIANHRKGRQAGIKIKINHITDPEMVGLLYRASREGVPIEIAVRGNFSMVTGIKGESDTIHASGIIDRYLEHSRIFCFCHNGKWDVFLGSADWMPRNLDHRVEVVVPVLDEDIKADCLDTVEAALRDNTHARVADGTGRNLIAPGRSEEPFRSQQYLHDKYNKRIIS